LTDVLRPFDYAAEIPGQKRGAACSLHQGAVYCTHRCV